MVDFLQGDYTNQGKPVLLLEQNQNYPQGVRIDRWYDAYGAQPAFAAPWVMVDSGYRVGGGTQDYEPVYRAMIDAALGRPPGAEVSASYERTNADVDVIVKVTNRSGATWTAEHQATVNVIVYERYRVLQTMRYVRSATARGIGVLADGATGNYYVSLVDVPMLDWDDGKVLVLVDYLPDPGASRFESLQAAHAVEGIPPTITPTPTRSPTSTASPTPRPTTPAPPTEPPTPGPSPTPTPSPTATEVPPVRPAYLPFALW